MWLNNNGFELIIATLDEYMEVQYSALLTFCMIFKFDDK